MICQHPTSQGHYLAGVISFVVSDRMDLPMGFTALSHYQDWLEQNLKKVATWLSLLST